MEVPELTSVGNTKQKSHLLRALEAKAVEELGALGPDQVYANQVSLDPARLEVLSKMLHGFIEVCRHFHRI